MSSDIHALSGAYAVDALDDAERAEFERHLAVCESCRSEVDDLRLAATEIAATTETAPPPALRASVLAGIGSIRPLPPLESSIEAPEPEAEVRRLPTRQRWTRIGLAAAAAVLLVAGAGVAWHPWSGGPGGPGQHATLTAADRIIHAPDVRHWSADVKGGGTVTVYRSVRLDRAVVVAHGMRRAPRGRTYQLWLRDPAGAMKPAGLFAGGADLTKVVRGRAATARGLGITVEPAGGSQVPTSTPIALVGLT
ncbi:MAG: anti-sigma factor [Nocardioidaceae bacterium]|nr:anti-sigma factor [Nocardioidaceae bacterium]